MKSTRSTSSAAFSYVVSLISTKTMENRNEMQVTLPTTANNNKNAYPKVFVPLLYTTLDIYYALTIEYSGRRKESSFWVVMLEMCLFFCVSFSSLHSFWRCWPVRWMCACSLFANYLTISHHTSSYVQTNDTWNSNFYSVNRCKVFASGNAMWHTVRMRMSLCVCVCGVSLAAASRTRFQSLNDFWKKQATAQWRCLVWIELYINFCSLHSIGIGEESIV